MFWRCNERRMIRAFEQIRDRLDLTEESNSALIDLTDWLAKKHDAIEEEWSHDDLLDSLVSDPNADKESVLKEVRESLAAMEEFAVTLVEKLDAFRATLSSEQKSLLEKELGARGRKARSWQGWHRRHRLRHRQRAA